MQEVADGAGDQASCLVEAGVDYIRSLSSFQTNKAYRLIHRVACFVNERDRHHGDATDNDPDAKPLKRSERIPQRGYFQPADFRGDQASVENSHVERKGQAKYGQGDEQNKTEDNPSRCRQHFHLIEPRRVSGPISSAQ